MIKYAWLLLLGAFSAQAAVYKCEQNGVVEFSQFPCSGDAETVDMRPLGTAVAGLYPLEPGGVRAVVAGKAVAIVSKWQSLEPGLQ